MCCGRSPIPCKVAVALRAAGQFVGAATGGDDRGWTSVGELSARSAWVVWVGSGRGTVLTVGDVVHEMCHAVSLNDPSRIVESIGSGTGPVAKNGRQSRTPREQA
jgi:hypothetical protein